MLGKIVVVAVLVTCAVSNAFCQSIDVQSEILGYQALQALAYNQQLRVDLEIDPAVALLIKERFEKHKKEYRELTSTFPRNAESEQERFTRIAKAKVKLRTDFGPKIAAELEEMLTPKQRRALAWTRLREKSSTLTGLFNNKSFQECLQIETDTATKIQAVIVEQVKQERQLAQKHLLESAGAFTKEQQDKIRDIVGVKLLPVQPGSNYKLSTDTPVPLANIDFAVKDLCVSVHHQEYVNLRPTQLREIEGWMKSSQKRRFDTSALEEVVGPNGLQFLLDKEQYVLLGQLYAQTNAYRGGLPRILQIAVYRQYIAPASEQLRAVADLEIGHAKARAEMRNAGEKETIEKIVAILSPESRSKLRELLGDELSFKFAVGRLD